MTDHAQEAAAHMEKAEKGGELTTDLHMGMANVHALLAVADAIKHGLRDIIYEMKD